MAVHPEGGRWAMEEYRMPKGILGRQPGISTREFSSESAGEGDSRILGIDRLIGIVCFLPTAMLSDSGESP